MKTKLFAALILFAGTGWAVSVKESPNSAGMALTPASITTSAGSKINVDSANTLINPTTFVSSVTMLSNSVSVGTYTIVGNNGRVVIGSNVFNSGDSFAVFPPNGVTVSSGDFTVQTTFGTGGNVTVGRLSTTSGDANTTFIVRGRLGYQQIVASPGASTLKLSGGGFLPGTVNAGLNINSTDKIGIGTESPATKFHMSSGSILLDGSSGDSYYLLGRRTETGYIGMGQGANNQLVLGWTYNATASLASATIGTSGNNNPLTINASRINITGPLNLTSKTKSELVGITPSLGDMYRCSDCSVAFSIAIATGAGAANFGIISPTEFK